MDLRGYFLVKIYKKAAGISTETLAKILLLLGFLVVAAFIIGSLTGLFSIESADRTVCYVSNALISSNAVFKSLMPTACSIELIEEPVDEERLSGLLKDTWHMFGEGDFDLGNAGHETFTPFAFKPKSDILFPQYYLYLQSHKNGKAVSDRSKSDNQYLQTGSFGQTLCVANNLLEENQPVKLSEGQLYYINLFDDQRPHDCGDKIILSKEAGFTEADLFNDPNFFFCYSQDTQRMLVVSATSEIAGSSLANLVSPLVGLGYFFSQDETTFCSEERSGGR